MIVDDDRTMVKLLKTLLELDDFEVSIVANGGEVLERAQQIQPDIFLMDYHLADVDGVEVVRALRASSQFAATPIVVTSGLDVEDEVIAAGANRFLIKPFEPASLPQLFAELVV